jgi:hypothetical protein
MLECPKCRSRNLRFSHLTNLRERTWTVFGIRPLRCRDCRLRFTGRTWTFSGLKYTRCPKCWRMDLNLWSRKDCNYVPFLHSALLKLGAHPFRCEYCRHNFVDFRARRERFSFHRWRQHGTRGESDVCAGRDALSVAGQDD